MTLIERAARAIITRKAADIAEPMARADYIERHWADHVGDVRVVLEAVREPWGGEWPAYRYCASSDEFGQPIVTDGDWQAMIDAALVEP